MCAGAAERQGAQGEEEQEEANQSAGRALAAACQPRLQTTEGKRAAQGGRGTSRGARARESHVARASVEHAREGAGGGKA